MDRLILILSLVVLSTGSVLAQAEPDEPERVDPGVIPIQFTQPGVRMAEPAGPIVRIQVRTLAALAPGKPLKYRIIVTNPSASAAYRVIVRHPIPKGTEGTPTMEPAGTPVGAPAPAEYEWRFAEFKPGTTKEIEVTYAKLDPKATSIKGTAFVSYEHGQTVTTDIEKPKLSVRKVAPETALTGEAVAIRVEVHNNGSVPVPNVKLTEDNDGEVEYVTDGDSEKGTVPGQRVWSLGTIAPGQSKFVNYRIRSKGAVGQLASTSNATGDGVTAGDPSQSIVKLLTAKTALDFTGPETVEADGTASYTAGVTNTGTMPLNRLRMIAAIPKDCTVAGLTTGGQRERGLIVWDFAPTREEGPLKPGQRYEVRFKLKCGASGAKRIIVDSDAGRGLEESKSVTTTFRGAVYLTHSTELQPGIVTVGQPGLVTFTVTNGGNTTAKNVTLKIQHNKLIDVKEISPAYTTAAGVVTFNPTDIPADGQVKFSLTYKAAAPGRADFEFTLSSDTIRDPLRIAKAVTVTK